MRAPSSLLGSLIGLRGNPRSAVYTEPMWGLSVMLVLPYTSVFMVALGLTDPQIGLLATVSMLSQVAFALLSGALTDKLGRRLTTAVFDVVAWVIPCAIWAVAQNFWYFLVASLINGAWQVTQNSWDCLLIEDVDRELIPRIYTFVKLAGEFSALFAPIAAVLVAQFGLEPAVRILYWNAAIVMAAKIAILFFWSTETRTGALRREATRGVPVWRLLAEYRGVVKLILKSKGTIFSLAISTIFAAVFLITGTFWQVLISQRLRVPDPLLPLFPMLRSLLAMLFYFTLIPALTHARHLKRPTIWGFTAYFGGQLLVALIPAPAGTPGWTVYAFLAVCLLLDAFGASILSMLTESLVAMHVDVLERSRVMAIQRTAVTLFAAPFGWVSGWLSGQDRTWPFLLTSALLAVGVVVTWRAWVTTHSEPAMLEDPTGPLPS